MQRDKIEAIELLSPIQQGILYETICTPEPEMHIEQCAFTLEGDLDIHAFERAWQGVVHQQAILRTAIVWKGQKNALQVTLRHADISISLCDCRAIPMLERQALLERYLIEDRHCGF